MNLFRPQLPYRFRPPKYGAWFKPCLHVLSYWLLKRRFNIQSVRSEGREELAAVIREGHSVLVTPNHADHADPSLLVQEGRAMKTVFHFMAAREPFETGRLQSWLLQCSGAFSVDREGADLSSIRTAIEILQRAKHPLVIFPEGEIYHHHEVLDELNEGVATILLRAAQKPPPGKQSFVAPASIRITHDPSVERTFNARLERLERAITWKPRPDLDPIQRIYRLGGGLLAIKETEFLNEPRSGSLIERIAGLQRALVEQVEAAHQLRSDERPIPTRVKSLRHRIRKELTGEKPPERDRENTLYDQLDRLFVVQQLYSYPGQYLSQNPTLDRIAETLFKLEEDLFIKAGYPVARHACVRFGKPLNVQQFLADRGLTAKTGVQEMTALLRTEIQALLAKRN